MDAVNSYRFVLKRIKNEIVSIGRILEIDSGSDILQEAKRKIRLCIRNLERIKNCLDRQQCIALMNSLQELSSYCDDIERNTSDLNGHQYSASRISNGNPGRPRVSISRAQLTLFLSEGYTASQISKHLHCSISVIYKRMYQERLKFRNKYNTIDDQDLHREVEDLSRQYPNSGSEMMSALLRAKGLYIQRFRVRKVLSETNPVGTAARWSNSIKRRNYKVPTPNSLWHMDAHLKLARWGFVTHSCIDGYSRLIIYSQCTTSITAKTVLDIFAPSIKKCGLPSRVRSDHGYENMFVALLMNCLRGVNRGSHITGRSVHNQRVERLWRDIFNQVLSVFYKQFSFLESQRQLIIDNSVHLFVLQFVYLEVINARLNMFLEGWNRHRVRTAGRKTPRQLWISGMLSNINSDYTAVKEIFNEDAHNFQQRLSHLLDDQETVIIYEDEEERISRFTATLQLNAEQLDRLTIIKNSFEQPVERYLECVQFLNENVVEQAT